MAHNPLAFLDNAPTAADEAAPEPEIVEAEASPSEPEPDPEADPVGTGDPPAAPPAAASEPQGKQVPIDVILAERDKRREAQEREKEAQRRAEHAEAQLAEMNRRIAQAQAQAQRPPINIRDNPEQAFQAVAQQAQQAVHAATMRQSLFLASREFGDEAVREAVAFFDKPENARFQPLTHDFAREPSPFHAAVEFVRRQKAVAEIGDDPDKWREVQRQRIREELLAEAQGAAPPPQAPPSPHGPPPSLASAPAAGRPAPAVKGSAFDAAFPR